MTAGDVAACLPLAWKMLEEYGARKRLEEFEKRLNNFFSKTKENKIITGFGGIEKYY